MKTVRWLLPALTLIVVLLVVWQDFQGSGTGPGPLHSVHAGTAGPNGNANCEACHQVGAGISAAGCNRCHEKIGEQLATSAGLHGQIAADERERCDTCHGEHHGDTAPLIAPHAFARSGVADVASYDHRHVAFGLTGTHTALACNRCHPHADDVAPPAGGRFLGLSQQCASCHDDVHHGAFGSECATCHGQQTPWHTTPLFVHAAFPLTDVHAQVACAECHGRRGDRSVASLRQTPQPARTCVECHETPHGTSTAPPTALRLANADDCRRCHTAASWADARVSLQQHAALGFALRGDHATTTCVSCHGDADQNARWSGDTPQVAGCATCHTHPHSSELLAAATLAIGPAAGCGGCHEDSDTDFAAGRMPAALHAATGFDLTPPHTDVACASCHGGTTQQERFPGRNAAECRACHTDVHHGQFDHNPRYGECTSCHQPTRFTPASFGIAAHADTAFPLIGAHDAVACSACHDKVHDNARQFRGTATACRACHVDVHSGEFDQPGRPKTVAGMTDCARCHSTAAFAPVTNEFDHAVWTGYELTGAHGQVACAACHTVATNAANRRLGSATGTDCADCHTDPHASQFADRITEPPRTDCRRCHSTASFEVTNFDHSTARFALDDVHRKLACSACHKSYESQGGAIVRYKPLGTTCGDCHALGKEHRGKR